MVKPNNLPVSSDDQRTLKKSNEKIRMLDITRDRPVKVAVKVAVPVLDHPKFNFVGKLLGPKGNSLKRLQEETMCKMAVLGRGSMRDRNKEEELRNNGDTRYAHLFEDLHVEISTFAAPAEAHARIAYALAEVRRFLVPDYHDDIRQEQMWEMQALSSSSTLNHNNNKINSVSITRKRIVSPNRIIEGGITDMDTSNDEKPANEVETTEKSSSRVNNTIGGTTSAIGMNLEIFNANTNREGESTLKPMSVATATGNSDILGIQNRHYHEQHYPLSTTNTATVTYPSTMPITLQHQLTSAATVGLNGILKPLTLNADIAVNGLASIPCKTSSDTAASTFALLDQSNGMLHTALTNVKTINIAGNMGRKRPLLGVPRSSINPTKRTVMTLLARAKNSQALHSIRSPVTIATPTAYTDSYQMLPPTSNGTNYVSLI